MNNDRFKFRVWNEKHNFYCDQNGDMVMSSNGDCFDNGIRGDFSERDGFIVEQCTGLKDKNGNLMYAGDRVRAIIPDSRPIGETAGYSEYTKETTGIIKWNDRCAGFVIEDVNEYLVFFYEIADGEDIEIIGNVHQTKEQQ